MSKILFKIITPERVVFSDEVEQVSMMTRSGEITVLPHHIPLVTILQPGELRYKKNGEELFLAVSGGFAEVRPDNTIVVLADTAEHAHEIDVERAKAAHDRAVKMMEEHRDNVDYTALQVNLERALVRLKVGNKWKKLPERSK